MRIQLAEKGIPFVLSSEVPWNSETQTPRWHPLEKLSVLICLNGESIFESCYINEWIEMRHPEPPLVPGETDGILAVKRFEIIVDGACDAMVLMFFEKAREEEKQSAPWYARQQRKLDGALRELAHVIGDKSFCHDHAFSMADIATGTLPRYLAVRWPQNDWRLQYLNLSVYSDFLEERPSFSNTRPMPRVIWDRVA